jgi:Outer membrane protein beta-barrel domain
MRFVRLSLVMALILCALGSSRAQDEEYSKYLFNIGGGISFPQGDLGKFVNDGGNFVVGGGYNFSKHIGVDSEFMWQDLPVNSATKQSLNTLGRRAGAYVIGGGGWYHRSGETTTPGTAVICDPYWSWWYGCTIGGVQIVTGSRSANAFGGNIGGGFTYRLGESHAKLYAEVRYHYASYNKVSTEILPLTFGIRW